MYLLCHFLLQLLLQLVTVQFILAEIFHLVVKCCSTWRVKHWLKFAAAHGLWATHHRLEARGSLRLSLPALAELWVLFFDDLVVLALKDKTNKRQKLLLGCVDDQRRRAKKLSRPCAFPSAPPCLRFGADTWAPSPPCFWRLLPPSAWVCPPVEANASTLSVCEKTSLLQKGRLWPPWWAPWPLQTWTGDRRRVWYELPRWLFGRFQPPPGGCWSNHHQTSVTNFSLYVYFF